MVDLGFTSNQGWYLTLLSSSLCILGCFVIFFDDIYTSILPTAITKRYKFQLKENYTFLNGALSFSCGCLLFTSLFKLLPEALEYLHDFNEDDKQNMKIGFSEKRLNFYLILSYISGALLCFLFNALLHLMTSQSVVHCNHHDEEHAHSHNDSEHNDDEVPIESSSCNHDSHTHTHWTGQEDGAELESTPLLNEQRPIGKSKSFIHYFTAHQEDDDNIGECKGYTSAELCLFNNNHAPGLHFCEIPTLARSFDFNETEPNSTHVQQTLYATSSRHSLKTNGEYAHDYDIHSHPEGDNHSSHKPDHHHHINTPLSRLLLIGIQTALAISLHKLPEGFITFITSEANPDLGFLIFLSLAAHNFTEGFLICLPLYFLFSSSPKGYAKLKAVSISAILGGLSQPLGAIIGYFFLKYNDKGESFDIHSLSFVLGISLAVTSGFLSVIGLSMYGSAISFNGGMLNTLLFWCIFGMCIIGLSSIVPL